VVHLVAYELKGYRPPSDYQRLGDAIKGISGIWCHVAESKYLVETELSTKRVAEKLAPFTIVGDPLFVTRIHRDWCAYSLTQAQVDWLQTRNFGSFAELVARIFAASVPTPAKSPLAAQLGNVAWKAITG
jgi:hypothetical protein